MCLCLKRSLPHHIVLYIGEIKISVYKEHDILFTSPALDFDPPAIHVHIFLNSRLFLGVKPIFRLCPSLRSSKPSPPKLDFGSAYF